MRGDLLFLGEVGEDAGGGLMGLWARLTAEQLHQRKDAARSHDGGLVLGTGALEMPQRDRRVLGGVVALAREQLDQELNAAGVRDQLSAHQSGEGERPRRTVTAVRARVTSRCLFVLACV